MSLVKEIKTKTRTFSDHAKVSEEIRKFVHDITKDAESSVGDIRKANQKYDELFNNPEHLQEMLATEEQKK